MQDLIDKFNRIKALCNDIHKISLRLSNDEISFYTEITVPVKFTNSELCFHTLISWLYVLYHEHPAKSIEFLKKKLIANSISITESSISSKQLIHAFRTLYQHQMDFSNSQSDIDKQNLCTAWFEETIGKSEPTDLKEWEICVSLILDYVIELLEAIRSFLISVRGNEHLDLILNDWKRIVNRSYSAYDYEKVLVTVLNNLGLSGYFDTTALAKVHSSTWSKDIAILPDGFNFEVHAYKIIERFILKKDVIPIDGRDIKSLGVENGKEIGELLTKAKELFYANPCSKDKLLLEISKLRDFNLSAGK